MRLSYESVFYKLIDFYVICYLRQSYISAPYVGLSFLRQAVFTFNSYLQISVNQLHIFLNKVQLMTSTNIIIDIRNSFGDI